LLYWLLFLPSYRYRTVQADHAVGMNFVQTITICLYFALHPWRNIKTPSLTPRIGRLPSEMIQYSLYRRLDGPQGHSGRGHKISPHRNLILRPSSIKATRRPTEGLQLQTYISCNRRIVSTDLPNNKPQIVCITTFAALKVQGSAFFG